MQSSRTTRFKNMSPEDRVNMAVEMSSAVSTITLESIFDRNPRISKAKLIQEGRKRFRRDVGPAEDPEHRALAANSY